MERYINEVHDEERAFYGLENAEICNCRFMGEADGESALKEASDITVTDCDFLLRYPFWHVNRAKLDNCRMTETCRAALWYDNDIKITNSVLGGIKALRECSTISLENCSINSTEFGWFCNDLKIKDCTLNSEYPFMKSADMEIENLTMTGKYSFQYTENSVIRNSDLNTKDAFWHSNNVTVFDSVIRGEYLGWYSQNLRLVRCKIIGTQPLCYAENLILEDCEMLDCDLSFEYSSVDATVNGFIHSIKNPKSGRILADEIGEIIKDNPKLDSNSCIIGLSRHSSLV